MTKEKICSILNDLISDRQKMVRSCNVVGSAEKGGERKMKDLARKMEIQQQALHEAIALIRR